VFTVRYYCPHCETVVTLQREGYLADRSVTPYPLEGWTYAPVGGDYDSADGVRIVCGGEEGTVAGEETHAEDGEDAPVEAAEDLPAEGTVNAPEDPAVFDGPGCGRTYYLNFVRFEEGEAVDPAPASRTVELGIGSSTATDSTDSPDRPNWPGR